MSYFKPEETACPCCGKTVKPTSQIMTYANHVRGLLRKPLTITSGFRCIKHNRTLSNSSDTSKHPLGKALDISTKNLNGADIYIMIQEAIKMRLRFGMYEHHIHVDHSRGEKVVCWRGEY